MSLNSTIISNFPSVLHYTRGLRAIFYLVAPWESSFKDIRDIPNYVIEAYPFFFLMILLEIGIVCRKTKNRPQYTGYSVADSISSLSAGILSQTVLLITRSIEVVTFLWVHEKYGLVQHCSGSIWIWLLGMVGVDCAYYWVHRMSHEIALFWSGHQVHHSSQMYNLTTALRQGVLQRYFSWMFYLPLAFVLTPSIFLVHLQFNLLYQFWIHTEVIDKLPPVFEFIFNTPSHHRVHHGRSKKCVDKNYGGVLIIFDRIFQTFEQEPNNSKGHAIKIAYGSIPPLQTWNPLTVQLGYIRNLFLKVCSLNIKCLIPELFTTFFYGPGYQPHSKNRLGNIEDIPEVENPIVFYGHKLSNFRLWYCIANFVMCTFLYFWMAFQKDGALNIGFVSYLSGLMVWGLVSVGKLLDKCNVDLMYVGCEIARFTLLLGGLWSR